MAKKKEWSYFTTNYRKSWIDFRKTDEYVTVSKRLKDVGVKQPFRDNMLKIVFAAAWRATGKKIKQI